MKKIALSALAALLVFAHAAGARVVGGAAVPEKLELAGEQAPLVLNGAGMRTKFFVKVYAAALYLPKPEKSAQAILESNAARVVTITMRRDVDSARISSAFLEGIEKNHTAEEMKLLNDRLTAFKNMLPSLKEDDVLRLQFAPDGETQVVVNNKLMGSVKGPDFQRAFLKIWLGETPVDADLKRSLLNAGP